MEKILIYLLFVFFLFQNFNAQEKRELRFNRFYQTKCIIAKDEKEGINYFIRFYPNGNIIEVGTECDTTPKDLESWFNLNSKYISIGNYKLKNNKIRFQTKNTIGEVKYKGKLLDENTIVLKSHSLINGNKDRNKYYYIE
ncbi:hypothetical protein ACFQO9_18910 [Chryseobacterium zhengzhouense]|uniref:Lipocalin-like domain-containing protein n=1 Tax=Chryseobacterium zhengzhouense TaxID=1636086 RepID=A0ABW2M5H6_9FLAO